MSTGCECNIVEVEPGKWYYIIEDYQAPKNSWDWREFATMWGPFESEDKAYLSCRDTHGNPGGYTLTRHVEYKPDKTAEKLLVECKARQTPQRKPSARFW